MRNDFLGAIFVFFGKGPFENAVSAHYGKENDPPVEPVLGKVELGPLGYPDFV